MADIDLPLTFTVEFELVFAFHESLLQAHLNAAHPGAAIVKNLTPAQRIDLNQVPTHYLNTIGSYAGWALTGSSTSRAAKRSIDGTIRTYGDEPLHVANGMLPGRLAYVYQGPDQARDFTRWELSHNPNLIGVDMQTLQRKLGDRIPDLTAANYWDSQGLNLTSPPLPISATSFAEIATTLAALTGHSTSLHGALTTPLCGTHVQVGLPPGSSPRAFPLLTLQHLAYILTMYESHISAMHAPHRQDNAAADLGSNRRTAFALDPARVVAKAVFDPVTRTVTRRNRWVYTPSLAEIRAAVFAPEMTLEGLVALMGGVEGLFVNWAGLLRPEAEGPPTLVFRQHEGSLYGASVKWWVLFVTGLVGLAHRLASEAGVDAGSGESEAGVKGFAFEEWHDNMSFVDLFEMMGFPLEGRRFLGSRVAFYAGGLERGRDETPGSGSGSWNGGDEREGTLLGKRGWDDDDGDEAGSCRSSSKRADVGFEFIPAKDD